MLMIWIKLGTINITQVVHLNQAKDKDVTQGVDLNQTRDENITQAVNYNLFHIYQNLNVDLLVDVHYYNCYKSKCKDRRYGSVHCLNTLHR